MTYIVTRLPNEPIAIAGFDLPLSNYLTDIAAWNNYCVRMVDQFGAPLFRIINLDIPAIDFSDLLLFIDDQHERRPGSISDPQMRTIVIGQHPFIQLGVKRLQDELGVHVPIMSTLEDALRYARAEIAKLKNA